MQPIRHFVWVGAILAREFLVFKSIPARSSASVILLHLHNKIYDFSPGNMTLRRSTWYHAPSMRRHSSCDTVSMFLSRTSGTA